MCICSKSNQIYWSNTTAFFGTSNHVKWKLREHGSQGWQGNMENHVKSTSHLKVSTMGELTISIVSLFSKIGSLREDCFPPVVSENCGGATWSSVLIGLGPLAPRRIPPVASQSDREICCRPRWGLREANDAREKRFSRRSMSSYGNSLMPLTIRVARRCMRSIRLMSRRRGLASPEPDTGVVISLVSRLQNHDEAGPGYVGRDY